MMPINISFSMNFGSLRLVSLSEQPPFGKELDIQMTDCYLSISANLVFKVFPYLFDLGNWNGFWVCLCRVVFTYYCYQLSLTHISLASFLWDTDKQNSHRWDAAKRGAPSGAFLFALRNFIEK